MAGPCAKRELSKTTTREATVTLRWAPITLAPDRSGKGRRGRKPLKLAAVYVREDDPPNVEPVEWMLLTTCAVRNAQDARRIVRYYEARWGIEVVHKIFKTGLDMEEEHVPDLSAFQRLLALLLPVAAHLARWTYASRICPDQPAATHVAPETIELLEAACGMHRLPLPEGPWTIGLLVLRLAQLGGYEPRRDAQPGWMVIWRGWRVLDTFGAIREHVLAHVSGPGKRRPARPP
jgi:hypothetical protein